MKDKKPINISFKTAMIIIIAIETSLLIACMFSMFVQGRRHEKEIEDLKIQWIQELKESKEKTK